MADQHGSSVALLNVSPDDHVFRPREKFTAVVAYLPQNVFPTAITQLFVYVGPRGGDKQVFKLMNTTPGTDPDAGTLKFEYTFPQDIQCPPGGNAVYEIGWDEEMQYTWEDAMKVFKEKGQQQNLLRKLLAVSS